MLLPLPCEKITQWFFYCSKQMIDFAVVFGFAYDFLFLNDNLQQVLLYPFLVSCVRTSFRYTTGRPGEISSVFT